MSGASRRTSSFFEIIPSCIYPLQRPENVKQSFCHRYVGTGNQARKRPPKWSHLALPILAPWLISISRATFAFPLEIFSFFDCSFHPSLDRSYNLAISPAR
jgi:hypothetical protein